MLIQGETGTGKELLAHAIELAQGNRSRAARWLGVTRLTLREKLRHFGLAAATPRSTHWEEQQG